MTRDLTIIIGLGATGVSCARYLQKRDIPFAIMDTRTNPPNLTEFKQNFPNVPCVVGQLDENLLARATQLVVSPGISLQEPAIAAQIKTGVSAIGDIELFATSVEAPVIAITGTNAKSTVTTLVGKMAAQAGKHVKVGGNLGIPALDLLSDDHPDLYVLELSSFQLETTQSLQPSVATVLNITPDHMDRYKDFAEYCRAKHQIYTGCKIVVCNRDDPTTDCPQHAKDSKFYFTLNEPRDQEFGLIKKGVDYYLAFQNQPLMTVKELPVLGRHYQANALAALAIGYGFGLPFDAMLQTLIDFKGLPHRCQLVRELNGISWYNDSKGTNVGAALAAIEGLGAEIPGKLVLIAGGVGKNADFSPLVPAIEKYVKTVVLIGEAADVIAAVIADRVSSIRAQTMAEAIALANGVASAGDAILLSPACASFDMFNNFEHRGDVFTQLVNEL